MNIQLDKGSLNIIKKLQENGYEAYLVGGSVRNALLDGKTTDFDITTSATPAVIMSLFPHTVPTGIQHGTVTIIQDHIPYEVTTYRADGDYVDSRHPVSVEFVRELGEDLKRRDFTINAMAYDPFSGSLVDPFGGKDDLKIRMIRAVGNPLERLTEDALRIIRGIRFATQLNFNIESETLKAMSSLSKLLVHISSERIYAELSKILMSKKPSAGIELMLYTGVLEVIMPELLPMAGFNQFSPYHDKDVFFHTMQVLDNTRPYLPLRLAALLHDSGKPHTFVMGEDGIGHFYGHEETSGRIAETILKRLKADTKTKETVLLLIQKHMVSLDMKRPLKIKRLIKDFGPADIDLFFEFKEADHSGKSGSTKLDVRLLKLKERVAEIINNKEPLEVSDLVINGTALLALGFPKSRLIGDVLEELLNEVLANPDLNRIDYLTSRALELKEKYNEPKRD